MNQKDFHNDKKSFPSDFFWGSATASYQVEGGIENNDWAEAARANKVPVCGRSTDHYNRFESDFDIAQSLGHNAHRISIEWSRIEPEEGKFDEKEIEHYRTVLRALRSRDIKPFVTLWHFTLPLWFTQKGGFSNKKAPEIFARYCTYVIDNLGQEAEYWMTINEPLVWASGSFLMGNWPPFKKNPFLFLKMKHRLQAAHRLAYYEVKKNNSHIKLGVAKHNIYFWSDSKPWNSFRARFMNWFWNESFLNAISDQQDFIGLNYYFHKKFGNTPNLPKTDMGWDIFPEGLYYILLYLKKYNKPIIITESGLADSEDKQRESYIRGHISSVKRAIEEDVPVFGFLYWSLLDNYEWSYGFTKRFGLVEIDYESLERRVRPSAMAFKRIIETGIV